MNEELKISGLVNRSSNPDCPACQEKRLHIPEEWKLYHPLAGTGHSREHGSPIKKT
jgi:hypothetical protein